MIIAIGSANKPKVNACHAVFSRHAKSLGLSGSLNCIAHRVDTQINDMPLTIDEMLRGARERALNVFKLEKNAGYAVGAEGGIFLKYVNGFDQPLSFLQSWVYCYNGDSGSWGSSQAIPIPWSVCEIVIQQETELADVIDQITGKQNVRSDVGAAGILTQGIVTRQDLFEQALESALAPFYIHSRSLF